MTSSWSDFAVALIVLVFSAAFEEILPKFFGVGFPMLLASVAVFAPNRNAASAFCYAVTAGALEDSLSTLPMLTSVSFCILLVVLARRTNLPQATLALAYPAYQLWLCVWVTDIQSSLFLRMLVSLPMGVITVLGTALAVRMLQRKAGVDEVS